MPDSNDYDAQPNPYLHGWPNHRARIRWESARQRWYASGTWGSRTNQQQLIEADWMELRCMRAFGHAG